MAPLDDQSQLYKAFLMLRSGQECRDFLTDLCTPSEIQAMVDRWRVAQLLHHQIPYREIYEQTGTSTATVTRVARSLTYGAGYRIILERLESKTARLEEIHTKLKKNELKNKVTAHEK